MVVIETVRGVTTRVLFLPVILTGFQEWNAVLAESLKRCQHYFDALTTNPLSLDLSRNDWTQCDASRKTSHLRRRLSMPPTND